MVKLETGMSQANQIIFQMKGLVLQILFIHKMQLKQF